MGSGLTKEISFTQQKLEELEEQKLKQQFNKPSNSPLQQHNSPQHQHHSPQPQHQHNSPQPQQQHSPLQQPHNHSPSPPPQQQQQIKQQSKLQFFNEFKIEHEKDEKELFKMKSEEILRLNILDSIPLKFQKQTNIIIYGCIYSKIELVANFLSEKLECEIIRNVHDNIQFKGQNLLLNCPKNFQETLLLQTLAPNHETYAIFVYSTLSNLLIKNRQKWIHKSSGRHYDTILNPPKSMTGTLEHPSTMFDDITDEPLEQVIYKIYF